MSKVLISDLIARAGLAATKPVRLDNSWFGLGEVEAAPNKFVLVLASTYNGSVDSRVTGVEILATPLGDLHADCETVLIAKLEGIAVSAQHVALILRNAEHELAEEFKLGIDERFWGHLRVAANEFHGQDFS